MKAFPSRNSLLVVLLLLCTQFLFAQESMLAMKYSVGQSLKYKVASSTLHEGGVFPGGRLETVVHLYYTLNVTEVDNEGTATVTFTQDSIVYWENSERVPYAAAEPLNGVPITMWFSTRGILVDAVFPNDMSKETAAYLDGLIKDFGSEPPLPGGSRGVGAEWKNDLSVYFIYVGNTVKTSNSATTKYIRKENFRGKECARIEYKGNLMTDKQQVGQASGTIFHSIGQGKILQVSSKTEAKLYVEVRGGKAQVRFMNTQVRDLLN